MVTVTVVLVNMPHPERLSRGFPFKLAFNPWSAALDAFEFYNKSRTKLFRSSTPSRLVLTVLFLSGLSGASLSP